MIDHAFDDVDIPAAWREALAAELDAPYMATLRAFLTAERRAGAAVFPAEANRFRALELTPPDRVRVVILGQDPYHGDGQAHGLAFSVRAGVKTPPSLVNIYKELQTDLDIPPAPHGFLEHWAAQGVLLLNTVLTVRRSEPGSHQKRGWEGFTDAIIRAVVASDRPVVFLLWGAHAQKKATLIAQTAPTGPHLILTAPHPSPLSAYAGFFGSRPFSQANAFLERNGLPTINWALPSSPFVVSSD